MNWENISTVLTTIIYMVSAVLIIRGIKLLGKADTARKGNLMSSVGMLIAVVTVLLEKKVTDTLTEGPAKNAYIWAIAAIALGGVIGAVWAKKVEMTGMPIINAFEARTVFVLKRGKGTGFSEVENPLFTNDNTVMIYGDAKQTVSSMVSEFDEG